MKSEKLRCRLRRHLIKATCVGNGGFRRSVLFIGASTRVAKRPSRSEKLSSVSKTNEVDFCFLLFHLIRQTFGLPPFSLRFGHLAVLTVHRTVIHYRSAALLPSRGRLGRTLFAPTGSIECKQKPCRARSRCDSVTVRGGTTKS